MLQKQGMYLPEFEHDNCGAGFICSLQGKKSNDIIHKALKILAVKQANTILDLGQAILAIEKTRNKERLELESVRRDAVDRLNNQKQQIEFLREQLEEREGVNTDAN